MIVMQAGVGLSGPKTTLTLGILNIPESNFIRTGTGTKQKKRGKDDILIGKETSATDLTAGKNRIQPQTEAPFKVRIKVNPQSISFNRKQIKSIVQGHGGFITQFWGNGLGSLKIDSFFGWEPKNIFNKSKTPDEAMFEGYEDVEFSDFPNSYPGFDKLDHLANHRILKRGELNFLQWGKKIYLGHFDGIDWNLKEATPHKLPYSFSMTVTDISSDPSNNVSI